MAWLFPERDSGYLDAVRLTENFTLEEFACRCCSQTPPEIVDRLKILALDLEIVRHELNRPISIISGYRCPRRNRVVGGAAHSRHLNGDAVDLQVIGYSGKDLLVIFEKMILQDKIRDGGLGTYGDRQWTLHYDHRSIPARWHHAKRERR